MSRWCQHKLWLGQLLTGHLFHALLHHSEEIYLLNVSNTTWYILPRGLLNFLMYRLSVHISELHWFHELYGYKYCMYIYVFVMRHVDALWKVGGGKWGVRSNGTSHPLPQMSSYHKSRQNLVKFHLSYIFASLCDTSATRLINAINLDWPWLFPEKKKFRESVKIRFYNWQIMLKLRSKHYYQILTWEQTSYCLKPELWSNKSTFPFLL